MTTTRCIQCAADATCDVALGHAWVPHCDAHGAGFPMDFIRMYTECPHCDRPTAELEPVSGADVLWCLRCQREHSGRRVA